MVKRISKPASLERHVNVQSPAGNGPNSPSRPATGLKNMGQTCGTGPLNHSVITLAFESTRS